MDLVGARNVETGFVSRIHNIRCRGNAAKLHLALDGLPQMNGLQKKDFANRLLIAVDEHYVERSFNPAKYGKASPEPVMEITFPSFRDESLAPSGKHVLSAVVQYAPYDLKGGWDDNAKEAFLDTCIRTLSKYAPDIESRISASELLTPADIEEQFNITGGHWHHGELTLDQFWFVRPVCSSAQYAMPIDGLYLCGAGAHPGGGVSGAAGRNAAKIILGREKAA
jgi:phytoene dehydrogenase-like protein